MPQPAPVPTAPSCPRTLYLGALGLAHDSPAKVAAQEVDRHLLAALGDLMALIGQEQKRAAPE